jgi:hypothetical protein
MDTRLQEAVIDNFGDIIARFKFQVRDDSDYWPVVLLYNDKCIFRFTDDHGSIEGSFINPIEKDIGEKRKGPNGISKGYPVYKVFSVWEFLYSGDKHDYRTESWDLEVQVKAIKKVLVERLSHVLDGDFSWTANYHKHWAKRTNVVEKKEGQLWQWIKGIFGQ